MHLRGSLTLLILSAACAYAQPSDPHAVVDGKAVSLSDIEGLVGSLPPQFRDPQELFRYYGVIGRLASKAEAAKLFEQSPYKEKLELQRKQIMAQAAMDQFYKDVEIPDAEVKEYFGQHNNDFAVAEAESVLIPVNTPADQDSAMAKARQAAAQMKAGTVAGAVTERYRKSDVNGVPAIRTAVFALKPGDVSAPVLVLPKGIYVFRLKSITVPEFDAARPDVWRTLADARFAAWMEEVRKSVTVTK